MYVGFEIHQTRYIYYGMPGIEFEFNRFFLLMALFLVLRNTILLVIRTFVLVLLLTYKKHFDNPCGVITT